MNSRDMILQTIRQNQPVAVPLPPIHGFRGHREIEAVTVFKTVLKSIGGYSFPANSYAECVDIIKKQFPNAGRIISVNHNLSSIASIYHVDAAAHGFENVDIVIIDAWFGVAENGSVYITGEMVKERVLPFICQHLVVLLPISNIVYDMHEAYEWIGSKDYGFATFITGPSKTADIEQSLVPGAHGPKTITVLLTSQLETSSS